MIGLGHAFIIFLSLGFSFPSHANPVKPVSAVEYEKLVHQLTNSYANNLVEEYTHAFSPLLIYRRLSPTQKKQLNKKLIAGIFPTGENYMYYSRMVALRQIVSLETDTKILEAIRNDIIHAAKKSTITRDINLHRQAEGLALLAYLEKRRKRLLGVKHPERAALSAYRAVKSNIERIKAQPGKGPLIAKALETEFGVGGAENLPALQKLMNSASEEDFALGIFAIRSLGEMRALPILKKCSEGNWKPPEGQGALLRRLLCIQALGQLGGSGSKNALLKTFSKTTEHADNSLQDISLKVKNQWILFAAAAQALVRGNHKEEIAALTKQVFDKRSDLLDDARAGFLAGLAASGQGAEHLRNALLNKNLWALFNDKRSLLREWISYLPGKVSEDALFRDLQEERKRFGGEIIEGRGKNLLRLNPERFGKILWEYVNDKNKSVENRVEVLRTIAAHHPKKNIAKIIEQYRQGNRAIDEFTHSLYLGPNKITGKLSDNRLLRDWITRINEDLPHSLRYPKPDRKELIALFPQKRKYDPCRNTCEILKGMHLWAKNEFLFVGPTSWGPGPHWEFALKSMGALFAAKAAPHCSDGYELFNAIMLNWFPPKKKKSVLNLVLEDINPINEQLVKQLSHLQEQQPHSLVRGLQASNDKFWKLDPDFSVGGWGLVFRTKLLDTILTNQNLQKALGIIHHPDLVTDIRKIQDENQAKLHLLVKGYEKHRRWGPKKGHTKSGSYGSYFTTHLLGSAALTVNKVPIKAKRALAALGERGNWYYYPLGEDGKGPFAQKGGDFARKIPGYLFLYSRDRDDQGKIKEKWRRGLVSAIQNYRVYFPLARIARSDVAFSGNTPHMGISGIAPYYGDVTTPIFQEGINRLLADPQAKSQRAELIEASREVGSFLNAIHSKDSLIEPYSYKNYPNSKFYVNALGGIEFAMACSMERSLSSEYDKRVKESIKPSTFLSDAQGHVPKEIYDTGGQLILPNTHKTTRQRRWRTSRPSYSEREFYRDASRKLWRMGPPGGDQFDDEPVEEEEPEHPFWEDF